MVQPGDHIDLAKEIADFLSNQSQLKTMAIASRQRAEQVFSLGRSSELHEVYQQVIDL